MRIRRSQGGVTERKEMIDPKHNLPINWQAEALGISRSNVYYQRVRCCDNVFVERIWMSIKYKEVYLHAYASFNKARTSIAG